MTIKTGRTHQIRVHLAACRPRHRRRRQVRRLRAATVAGAWRRGARRALRAHVPACAAPAFDHPASGERGRRSRRRCRRRATACSTRCRRRRRPRHDSPAPLRPDRLRLGRHAVRLDRADRALHPGGVRATSARRAERSRRQPTSSGSGLTDALHHAAPDLPPERYPELGLRYRHHYLASQDELVLFDGTLEMLHGAEGAPPLAGGGDRQDAGAASTRRCRPRSCTGSSTPPAPPTRPPANPTR